MAKMTNTDASAEISDVTPDELLRIIQGTTAPLLLDVWGAHCAPCKALDEVLQRQQNKLLAGWVLLKLCANDFPEWAEQNAIYQVPTVLVYLEGTLVQRELSLLTDGQLQRLVTSVNLKTSAPLSDMDILIQQQNFTGVRNLLKGLSGEEQRAPQYQRASSLLAMHDMPLGPQLKPVRDCFINTALNRGWELALTELYQTLVNRAQDQELLVLSFALLDLMPDRLVAQKWRREFHGLYQQE